MFRIFLMTILISAAPVCAMDKDEKITINISEVQDSSFCTKKLLRAASHASDAQAIKDMGAVMCECKKEEGAKMVQRDKALSAAIQLRKELAIRRLMEHKIKDEWEWQDAVKTTALFVGTNAVMFSLGWLAGKRSGVNNA